MSSELENLRDMFGEHAKSDSDNFDAIHNTLKEMKNNHLHHIEKSMESMSKDLARNTTDTEWLKKFLFLFMTPAVTVIIGAVLYSIIK